MIDYSFLLHPSFQADLGFKCSKFLLVLNQADCNYTIEHYGRTNRDIFVYRNGIDHVIDQQEAKRPLSTVTAHFSSLLPSIKLLFLGSWLTRKGIRDIVNASVLLHEHKINYEWVLAGTGVNPEIVLADFPDDIRKNILVIQSFNSKEEEAWLYHFCDLFILPSLFEGQPLALLQAMAYGKCCITTNSCGQADLIQNGRNGYLYEPGDYRKLADLIEQADTNPHLRESIGRNAQKSVSNRYWKTVSEELVAAIDKVSQSPNDKN